jgi:hypothetical protein
MGVDLFLFISAYSLLANVFLDEVDIGGLEGRLYHRNVRPRHRQLLSLGNSFIVGFPQEVI